MSNPLERKIEVTLRDLFNMIAILNITKDHTSAYSDAWTWADGWTAADIEAYIQEASGHRQLAPEQLDKALERDRKVLEQEIEHWASIERRIEKNRALYEEMAKREMELDGD